MTILNILSYIHLLVHMDFILFNNIIVEIYFCSVTCNFLQISVIFY